MKEWKSRIGVDPPVQFFAEVIAYLNKAFPGARLNRETVRLLRPYLVSQWRLGQNAAKAAAATCSCDGLTIVPSPASQVDLPRRAALAPSGAKREDVFGLEDLREPGALPRIRVQAEIAQRQYEHYKNELDALQAQAAEGAGKASKKVASLVERTNRDMLKWAAKANELRAQVDTLAASAPWTQREGARAVEGRPRRAGTRKPAARAKAPVETAAAVESPIQPVPKKKPCRDCAPKPAAPPENAMNPDAMLDELVREFAESAAHDIEGKQ